MLLPDSTIKKELEKNLPPQPEVSEQERRELLEKYLADNPHTDLAERERTEKAIEQPKVWLMPTASA